MGLETAAMAIPAQSVARPSTRGLHHSQDLATTPEAAFELICAIEKWPVWLSFLRSSRRLDPSAPLGVGAEVALRSSLSDGEEELYEVDQFMDGYLLSLVGAYSVRRRIDFRVERKTARSKIVVRMDYPSYGGLLGSLVDRMTLRRRLDLALADSLVHFKGLVEFEQRPDGGLDDF